MKPSSRLRKSSKLPDPRRPRERRLNKRSARRYPRCPPMRRRPQRRSWSSRYVVFLLLIVYLLLHAVRLCFFAWYWPSACGRCGSSIHVHNLPQILDGKHEAVSPACAAAIQPVIASIRVKLMPEIIKPLSAQEIQQIEDENEEWCF